MIQITTTRVDETVIQGLNKIGHPMYKQPKPIMRQSSYADFYQAVQVAVDRVIKQPMTVPYQNCLNCDHWDFGKDLCGLHKAKPPTEIIVYSCPDYKDNNDIPF